MIDYTNEHSLLVNGIYVYKMKTHALRIITIVSGIIVTLFLIEVALALAGVFPIYQVNFEAKHDGTISCDDTIGCHHNYDVITAECTQHVHLMMRHCNINQDGYFDSDDFQSLDDLGAHRILLMGDSFTFGYTAEIGRSWAEVAEQTIQDLDITVWNAATPGTATQNAILKLEQFTPSLNPQLAILGFHFTDIYDNTLPIDQWYILDTGRSGGIWVKQYRLTDALEVEQVSPTALYFRAQGVDVTDLARWQRVLLSTRTGTVILPRLMGLQLRKEPQTYFERPEGWYEAGLKATSTYLQELKSIADQHRVQLLVLVIPDNVYLKWNTSTHDDITNMLDSLSIAYITVDDLVNLDDYVNDNPNDTHWNNSGHGKAGQRVGACLRYMLTNNYEWCSDVVAPSYDATQ